MGSGRLRGDCGHGGLVLDGRQPTEAVLAPAAVARYETELARLQGEITAAPGESFVDRMIALVEGAERQKTPNEIALNILLAALPFAAASLASPHGVAVTPRGDLFVAEFSSFGRVHRFDRR